MVWVDSRIQIDINHTVIHYNNSKAWSGTNFKCQTLWSVFKEVSDEHVFQPFELHLIDIEPLYKHKEPVILSLHAQKHVVDVLLTQGSRTMMTSSNGNISRVTGHLCWEFTGPRLPSPSFQSLCGFSWGQSLAKWFILMFISTVLKEMNKHVCFMSPTRVHV